MNDPVNHPEHYTSKSMECIELTRWMGFNTGNAVKYLWRCGLKGNPIQDLQKARWYVLDEYRKQGFEHNAERKRIAPSPHNFPPDLANKLHQVFGEFNDEKGTRLYDSRIVAAMRELVKYEKSSCVKDHHLNLATKAIDDEIAHLEAIAQEENIPRY